ncbi:hypothetical protein NET02_16120 [Thermomicrobiaceae bacterium CFH 74404]|uniref:Uncharacterized protein n=1 Tax=Thermalbibacter longus TaxID=2951981 RepID=A0AA41WHQ2_9BACT|nr:hypothetical protein [Thermalbibacter longus]MCM8750670.1 hypothetical protein [Thermalbibacter longus]
MAVPFGPIMLEDLLAGLEEPRLVVCLIGASQTRNVLPEHVKRAIANACRRELARRWIELDPEPLDLSRLSDRELALIGWAVTADEAAGALDWPLWRQLLPHLDMELRRRGLIEEQA